MTPKPNERLTLIRSARNADIWNRLQDAAFAAQDKPRPTFEMYRDAKIYRLDQSFVAIVGSRLLAQLIHGVASQMFLIGENVQADLIGEHPGLEDLIDGDLKHHTDFRQAYAAVLDQWLNVSSNEILGRSYPPIGCWKRKAN